MKALRLLYAWSDGSYGEIQFEGKKGLEFFKKTHEIANWEVINDDDSLSDWSYEEVVEYMENKIHSDYCAYFNRR